MIRLREIQAVNRAQCIISGGCWRRLSDAIVRRARRAWLIDMSIDMRLSMMPGLGRTRSRWAQGRADRADTDIGPHWMFASQAEAAAYMEEERTQAADWADVDIGPHWMLLPARLKLRRTWRRSESTRLIGLTLTSALIGCPPARLKVQRNRPYHSSFVMDCAECR